MRNKFLTHKNIEYYLQKGTDTVQKIIEELKVDSSISLSDLIGCVVADLIKMGITIGYEILFDDVNQQSIPSVVTEDRDLKLNDEFSESARIEALFHEYIHIKDDTLSSIEEILNDETITDKEKALRDLENLVDITALTLMMPPEKLKQDLLEKKYNNIPKLLSEKYNSFQRCSVLQWIAIISHFSCHFVWLMIKKNINYENKYDCCYYDHKNDPQDYDIDTVLNIPHSAAAKAYRTENYAINNESKVGSYKYQCFAFYEKGINRAFSNVELHKEYVQFDRLVVIGWKRRDKLKFFTDLKKYV